MINPKNLGFLLLGGLLFFNLASSGQEQMGSVFERQVSIYAQNEPLGTILNQIGWQAKVFFSYDASSIESNKKYSMEVTKKSLFTVLHLIFDPDTFKLTELENQIVITKKSTLKDTSLINHPRDVKYFFLRGKILDSKKRDPLVYASISLKNRPLGTITNSDGEFLLKLHPDYIYDTLVISSLGYAQSYLPSYQLLDDDIIFLEPVSIRIGEVKVTAITPQKLLENVRERIETNYSSYSWLMPSFYRETVQQDGNYINVSEAVVEILKAPYNNTAREDVVRLQKGRQSPDLQPFKWLSFKLQGGPFTITKLDIVKTNETFLDKAYEHNYKYDITRVIQYNNNPAYVLEFEPVPENDFHGYTGKMYIHRETFAILYVNFGFNRSGLKKAASVLIKRKPHGVRARPSFVQYEVTYKQYRGKWYLSTARASVIIKVRSRSDDINSDFHSRSELLVTDIVETDLRRFSRDESIRQQDIFVELVNDYDPGFWENYNIIKPDEDLQNAIRNFSLENYK